MSTILVVDDTLTDLEVASGCLMMAGFDVVKAVNEQDAKTKISSQRPDLIVLDVVLPDRSGFEFCRDLKDNPETSNIPVIIWSSKGSKMDVYWGMQQGADAYLPKPLNADQLVKTVQNLV